MLTEASGQVEIDVPRDRAGTFEPQIVRKRQRRLSGVDEVVPLLYAKGLTAGEISAHFAEINGASVSKETVSRITDKVIEEMNDWAVRPLDAAYAAVFIDAIVVKVRDGQVANRPSTPRSGSPSTANATSSGSEPGPVVRARSSGCPTVRTKRYHTPEPIAETISLLPLASDDRYATFQGVVRGRGHRSGGPGVPERGVVFKRCGCRNRQSGRRLEGACSRLRDRGHGSWYFHCSVPTLLGAGRVRRGGFPSRRAAVAARDVLWAQSAEDVTAEVWTVGRWLRWWLGTRVSLRPSPLRSYTDHVERHLIPYLGRVRLAELTGRDVAEMFAVLTEAPGRLGRPLTPSSLHRIRATLRAALNAAVRDGLLRDNPARNVELRAPRRPPAQVWTAARVEARRDRGERSTVAVWTEHQFAEFLDYVAADRLYGMWWLVGLRGLRRGEAAGLRWVDVDLNGRSVTINQQRLAYGRTVAVGPPKTLASRRTIALDRTTVAVLRAHRRRQETERAAAGQAWHESGYVFTTASGQPLQTDFLTRPFRTLVERSGLPPVRLHDLRHGAASLAHSAGGRRRPAAGPPPRSAATAAARKPEPGLSKHSRRRKGKKPRRTHKAPARHPRSSQD